MIMFLSQFLFVRLAHLVFQWFQSMPKHPHVLYVHDYTCFQNKMSLFVMFLKKLKVKSKTLIRTRMKSNTKKLSLIY